MRKILKCFGYPRHFVDIIQSIHDGSLLSEHIKVRNGVKQDSGHVPTCSEFPLQWPQTERGRQIHIP